MAEYIEREALERYIRKEFSHLAGLLNYIRMYCPTTDVVEVRRGEWVEWGDEMLGTVYMCSVCKVDFVTEVGTPSDNLWNYCPNCGAKMDGKGENDG